MLARLASRYFRSHGPATSEDFAWWSGLSQREARTAMELAGEPAAAVNPDRRRPKRSAWLLPYFDEYLVAYKNRTAIFNGFAVEPRDALAPTTLIDGVATGRWRARRDAASMTITVSAWRTLTRADIDALHDAAARYGTFLGKSVALNL
jgi:hypothetical protein